MKRGVVIFAHNNRDTDYALMAVIAGGLAKKHLNLPVSLITDKTTISWMKESKIYQRAVGIFENIIEIKKPQSENKRRLHDGASISKIVPFVNNNRSSVLDLTPYDKTLLIDSDFLIFSDRLNEYWDMDDVLISDAMNDIVGPERTGYHDRYISDTGVHMFWATAVMFTKNDQAKSFFNMVQYVRDNYQYYGDLFRFDTRQYRNDIAFSVAKHILTGFESDRTLTLPAVFTSIDKDILYDVDATGKLTFLISHKLTEDYCTAVVRGRDIHVMNKQSLVRHADKLLELI